MIGNELYEHVFADEIEHWGELSPYEIQDLDEVTCYDENLSYHDGWYIVSEITFRYRGKKYAIERKDHSSDNVCDTEWLFDTFREVVETTELAKAVNRIISNIEDETVGTWEEIIRDLEDIKRRFAHLEEV
jgi:hypothetical protein